MTQSKRSRIELLLIVVLAVAPVAAAYVAYYFWQPQGRTNYGELLEPQPLPDVALTLAGGGTLRLRELKGKWLLLTVDSGACDANCRSKLYTMRQVRLAQGKDMERIERAWLIDDGVRPDPELLAQYPGMLPIAAQSSALLGRLPAARDLHDHVFLVDPLGNLMMRFPRDADARRVKQDLTRLLKISGVG